MANRVTMTQGQLQTLKKILFDNVYKFQNTNAADTATIVELPNGFALIALGASIGFYSIHDNWQCNIPEEIRYWPTHNEASLALLALKADAGT